jgi:transposase
MFSYVGLEERVGANHPLRRILTLVDKALLGLNEHLGRLYAPTGRDSIPPERLLRALVLQALYSIRSEGQLVDQLDFNLLYRWFVGLGIDEPVWDKSVFTKNRDRLLEGDVAQRFFSEVLSQARAQDLLSSEHFSVDGTLIEAWASHKSFKRKDGPSGPPAGGKNPEADFRKEKRGNETHQSTTDPEARLYRKSDGAPAQLCYLGHALMENRNSLVVAARVTQATGTAEREAALGLIETIGGNRRVTLGADKNYDTRDFVDAARSLKVTPHVAQNTSRRRSAIDARTTRHVGYAVSQVKRKRIEEPFGWIKTVAGLRKVKLRGRAKVAWLFTFAMATYNLVRLTKLIPAPG